MLTLQAHLPALHPPKCIIFDPNCEKVGGANAALMYISIYLVAFGMAGVKAGVPAHGADQFDENDPKEVLSMSSFFNWFLVSIVIGASFSVTFVVYIQEKVGFGWGFGISTIGMFLGIIVFVAGIPTYRIHVTRGISPVTEIIQVEKVSLLLLTILLF